MKNGFSVKSLCAKYGIDLQFVKFVFNSLFAVLGWLASAVTIGDSSLIKLPSGTYGRICVMIFGMAIWYIWMQWVDYQREKKRVFRHSSAKEVHAYLYNWIKTGGRTVVFTRDFTWANYDNDMLDMFQEKAKKGELIVCLYRATDITDQLKELGAEIYTHDLQDLRSRFTIIHYGTNCPQITVGSIDVDGSFINERYNMQFDPNIYNIFVELFESAKATSMKNTQV